MEINYVLEKYLRKIIEYCQAYDAFSIPAAMMARGEDIRLQDVYTPLPYVARELYEKISSFSSDINSIISKLDDKFVEFENGSEIERCIEYNDKTFSEGAELSANKELNWTWFLSAPGGGKTTLLKMYCLAYAYRYYVKQFGHKEKIFKDWQKYESICEMLNIKENDGACPFFISVRELQEENYLDIESVDGFRKLIIDTADLILGENSAYYAESQLLMEIPHKVYFVDSVEEFPNYFFRDSFLEGLESFAVGNHCYLSERYREYMESIKESTIYRHRAKEEYVIKELQKDTVRQFTENWYKALNKIDGRKKLDPDKDFLIPLYKNPNVKNLISNPLELASLLMISSYDSYLPSDYSKIYGRSIELWLSWGNQARYNYEDVLRQLSQVAYKMAISDQEKIIVKPFSLVQFIKSAREELKRYYQQEWSTNAESINEFIQFLCRCHLINKSTDGYDFIHRQYHAYLVAYCISTNNFSRETRKKNKFDYIKDHILEKDNFWNQIYKIIAIMDIELRDDIITTLFELSDSETYSKDSDNYYVARLIELAIIPGVNFDEYEREKLIKLIFKDKNRWKLLDSNIVDLRDFLLSNDKYSNELFIETAINKYNSLISYGKEEFRNAIVSTVFFCMWHCDVGEKYIRNAVESLFSNYLSTNILQMIFDSKELTKQQEIVKNVVYSLCNQSIQSATFDDYYMLIAAIMGNEGNPYECVDRLINQNTFESNIIAINILIIAAWLIRCKRANRYGYKIEVNGFNKYADFILKGITSYIQDGQRTDYLNVFVDIFAISSTNQCEDIWFRKDVFEIVLKKAILNYKNDGLLFDEKDGFHRCIEHISFYPCNFRKHCQKIINELHVDPAPIINRLNTIYLEDENILNRIHALKLLIIMSDVNYDTRAKMLKDLEKTAKTPNIKEKLEAEDSLELFQQFINQIKTYVPEGKKILDELNLDDFKLCLETNTSLPPLKPKSLNDLILEHLNNSKEYIDYYEEQRYEEAKQLYLNDFSNLISRNNLAYMLRRGEIPSVEFKGIQYSVDMLLKDGIEEREPYSLINYALFISYNNEQFDYELGLNFLIKYKDTGHLLDAACWWYELWQNGELEGCIVCMWLCDLDLISFESKEQFSKQVSLSHPNKIYNFNSFKNKGEITVSQHTNIDKILFLLSHAKKNIDLCVAAYQIISKAPTESHSVLLEVLISGFKKVTTDNVINIPTVFTIDAERIYAVQYQKTVTHQLDTLINKGLTKEMFYSNLAEYIMTATLFKDDGARAFAIFLCCVDHRLPYANVDLSVGLKMENDELSTIIKQHVEEIEKINYILDSKLEQKTEKASLLLNEIESFDDFKKRTVLLAVILDRYQELQLENFDLQMRLTSNSSIDELLFEE